METIGPFKFVNYEGSYERVRYKMSLDGKEFWINLKDAKEIILWLKVMFNLLQYDPETNKLL
jgi:hypothetical protein